MARETREQERGPFGSRTLQLGRILGIAVGVDPSWFLIFALVTISLGGRFEEQNAEWPVALAWGAGLAASLLYFLSILAHELGHSITSKLLGLPVISITLFLFGGLARLSGEPDRPRDELLIALAGPAVSVLLGMFFLVVYLATGDGTVVGEVAFWLGSINLALAIFNMIPGFPLDGGHVFRAFLWAAFDDLDKATRWAGAVGGLFARFLIGLGIASVIFGGAQMLTGGLFMAFIGWFLLRAARGSVWQSRLKHYLEGVQAGEAMESTEHRIDAWSTVEDAALGGFSLEGRSCLFVEQDGELTGLLTLEEVSRVPVEKRAFQRVTEVMTPIEEVGTIGPRETLFSALEAIERAGADRLLVVDEGETLGALSRDQISRVLRNRMTLGS